MNYRHAFHAGNFADVFKHAVLARAVAHLLKKDTPFRYIDTHAGIGIYDIQGDEASRTGEWRDGIGRLLKADLPADMAELLAPYLGVVRALNKGEALRSYPGSPEVVRRLVRENDRLTLCEKHPKDAAQLRYCYGRDGRVKALEIDGWTALNAFVPPAERRGLVLIDPPFEETGELAHMRVAMESAWRKWRTGSYFLWYPIKDILETDAFAKDLARTGIPKILRAEVLVQRPAAGRLNGSGLVMVNPPWPLAEELPALCTFLAKVLGRDDHARGRVDWLVGEN